MFNKTNLDPFFRSRYASMFVFITFDVAFGLL